MKSFQLRTIATLRTMNAQTMPRMLIACNHKSYLFSQRENARVDYSSHGFRGTGQAVCVRL